MKTLRIFSFLLPLAVALTAGLQNCKKAEPDPVTPTPTNPGSTTTTPGTSTTTPGTTTTSTGPVIKAPPTISNITTTGVTVTAIIDGNGGEAITQHGFSIAETGKTTLQAISKGATSGPFPLTVTEQFRNLQPNTAYTIYFFAVNKGSQTGISIGFRTAGAAAVPFVIKADSPNALLTSHLMVVGSTIYGLYNFTAGAFNTSVWEFDLTQNKWTQKTGVPVPNYTTGQSWKSNVDFLYKGQIYTKDLSNRLYSYNPTFNTWSGPKATATLIGSSYVTQFTIADRVFLTSNTDWLEYLPETDRIVARGKLPDNIPALDGRNLFIASETKGYLLRERSGVTGVKRLETGYQLYEFDPATNLWTENTNWSRVSSVRTTPYNTFYGASIVGQTLYAYVDVPTNGSAVNNELLAMNLATGEWKSTKTPAGGTADNNSIGQPGNRVASATVGSKGYFLTLSGTGKYQLVEFTPPQ